MQIVTELLSPGVVRIGRDLKIHLKLMGLETFVPSSLALGTSGMQGSPNIWNVGCVLVQGIAWLVWDSTLTSLSCSGL